MAHSRSSTLTITPPGQDRASASGTSPVLSPGPLASFPESLLDALPDAVLCLDSAWRITYANAEARRISRLTTTDLHQKTHWEIFPETVGTPLDALYREVMATQLPGHIEYFYRPFDLWADIHVIPTGDGIALHYRDITGRKRAEAIRNISISQLQQVLDASPNAIICIDRDWNCNGFNKTARTLLKDEDLLGASLWTLFPRNQEEPFASCLRTTMEQRVPTEFEAFYPAPLDLWFKVVVRPYEDGIIIFAGEISDRRRAEAARDASVRQLEQVFEATTDGVVSISRDWTITFINRQAASILGRHDLIGRNLWEEFPVAVDTQFYERYHQTMEHRTSCEFEEFYPDPLNLWVAVQCRPSDDGIIVFFSDITAERAAKQVLLDQQATLSFVQQTARVATAEIDLATGAMVFSDGSFPVFGRPCSEVSSLDSLRSIVHPDDLAYIRACIQTAIQTASVTSFDYRVIAPDGAVLWVEARGLPVYNAAGNATHLRGMTTDITARKRSEEALIASEARYRVLTDLNPQAIWMGTPDGRVVYTNQGLVDYTSIPVEELAGLGWLTGIDPADRDRVLAAWTHSVATGEEYLIDARLLRAADGVSRWWTLRALPIRNEAGIIQQWLGVANDIHDTRMAAEELRRQQEETERQRIELETVYRTAPIGLALFDPVDFRYLRLNDRQAEIVGLPPEQVLGQTLTDVAPIDGLREMFEQVAAGHPIQDKLLEGELPTRPGEHRYFTVNYSPVYAPDGSVQAIAAASLEITHQKKSELALIQSEKLAAVGRLASSISHEINNPLEAITNLLFLVALNENLPESAKTYIQMAQSELGRVSQIVTQTLRFHRQAVNPTSVYAADLVNAVLNLYQGRLNNSGIRIQATYASQTPILCFENDIRQVLNNLIANAIDAMRGGGRLVIRAHDVSAVSVASSLSAEPDRNPAATRTRKGVRITIADTGHGMSPAVLSRIFEPFYTTKDLNGTGLGLWISAGIVTHHHGRLTVRSSQHPIHHGTVFTLFLPCKTQ